MLNRDDARKLIDRVLALSKAEACEVNLGESSEAYTRFANNGVTTSGRVAGVNLTISSTKGTRTGTATTNETDEAALKEAVAKSEELAGFATPDPEYVEPLPPQKYPDVSPFDEATTAIQQEQFVPGVREAIAGSEKEKLVAAGFMERDSGALAIGNSRGNFGFARRTDVSCRFTVRTPEGDGSGWAFSNSHRFADVDAPAAARVAIDKCRRSKQPRPLEPGRYTVVLEPAAVRDLIEFYLPAAFDARAAEEGRSVLTRKGGGTRLGERLFSEKTTLRSDPFDPRHPTLPWQNGLPVRPTIWVEKGVVKNLSYGRYWARKKEVEPTTMAGLVLDGEDHSLDELIAATERGLLITRFWYIRSLNPQTVQLTGLTRDGVFMIEKGKVVHPVINFRWNESPVNVLSNVEMMSRNQRVGTMIVPALKVREFPFSSPSDAV
jgi:predicted Zn-dependent protease